MSSEGQGKLGVLVQGNPFISFFAGAVAKLDSNLSQKAFLYYFICYSASVKTL